MATTPMVTRGRSSVTPAADGRALLVEVSMKNLDNANGRGRKTNFGLELTRVLPLWNHPKTVALCFARREAFLKRFTAQRNFVGRFAVKK
jgi:hypothetical protein